MFSAFINSFKIKELRNRIFFTAGILILCRVAANIPCPGVDTANLDEYFTKMSTESATGQFLGMFDLFSGGALLHFAIGALGIMPYISASIIMQLLTPVVPSLEKLQREGEIGRAKINQYTRYLTIVICLVQGAMAAVAMTNPARLGLPSPSLPLVSNPGAGFIIMSMIILTAGTMILVWLGERITEHGIGNGVSIIITANIIERLPQSLLALFEMMNSGFSASGARFRLVHLLLLFVIFAAVTALTVMLTQGQRRVPIQMAKRIIGNKMSGGTTYMPLKVNLANVMPIIFGGMFMMIPGPVFGFIAQRWEAGSSVFYALNSAFSNHTSVPYMVVYAALIMGCSFLWVANIFNPGQISENLKRDGAYIPGIPPGQATAKYLDSTMTKVTFGGAVFLTALALFPTILTEQFGVSFIVSSFFGGTSILIMVGVVLETMTQLESHLTMRNYDGFLKSGRLRGRR